MTKWSNSTVSSWAELQGSRFSACIKRLALTDQRGNSSSITVLGSDQVSPAALVVVITLLSNVFGIRRDAAHRDPGLTGVGPVQPHIACCCVQAARSTHSAVVQDSPSKPFF